MREASADARGPAGADQRTISKTAGVLPTTAGSLALANNVTNRDAPLVARLRSAGAIILGKTNLSEWANIRSSHSLSGWRARLVAKTRNPWALDRNSCGSSSGSGAAVAAGMVPLRDRDRDRWIGNLPGRHQRHRRPEADRRPGQPDTHRPISHSQDTAGPMTRDSAGSGRNC